MKIGSLDSGFDYEKVRKLLNVGQLEPKRCKSCWAISLCGICARGLEDGCSLSVEKRTFACKRSKLSAYGRILERILFFEHEEHMRGINCWQEVKKA